MKTKKKKQIFNLLFLMPARSSRNVYGIYEDGS